MTLEEYLDKISEHAGDAYGGRMRRQFADNRGSGELGMLISPSNEELEQLRRAVAIMTKAEKENARNLGADQIQRIAEDAKVDSGTLAIFLNGYDLESKRVSQSAQGRRGN